MGQDNLLDRLLSKGTTTSINTPKAVAFPQGNKIAAIDQSLYRFKPVVNSNLPKNPLGTPLAKAATPTPTHIVPQPTTTSGNPVVNTPVIPTVVTYLLTEVGEELMTEDNNNLVL